MEAGVADGWRDVGWCDDDGHLKRNFVFAQTFFGGITRNKSGLLLPDILRQAYICPKVWPQS